MKLNLLPTSVSREKTVRRAIVVAVLLSFVSLGLSVAMTVTSSNAMQDAKAQAADAKPKADAAVALAASADTIIGNATPYIRNVQLVHAIDSHTKVYPEFYAKLMPYLPSFFRIISMQAAPIDGSSVNVTLVGVIKNQTMYNDLKFALLRIPGVGSIAPSPIGSDDVIVPNLTPQDMVGRPHKQSEPTVPDDPIARLNQALSRGGTTDYLGVGNFGSGTNAPRQAMPNYNVITVTFRMPGNLQAPNIRSTLAAAGSAPAPVATTPASATAAAAPATGFGAPGGKKPAAAPAKPAGAPPARGAAARRPPARGG